MKARAYAPALLAVAALVGIYVFVTRSGEDAEPTRHAEAPRGSAPPAVAPSVAPAESPPPGQAPAESPPPGQAPTKPPHLLTPEEFAGHEPKAKKAKLTLEEKLVETQKHIVVMERRAQLLEAEIAELERTGDKAKAAEQRIVLARLREHADKLRQAVAEGREPL